MNDKEQTLDSILTTVRSIIGVLKDSNIPHEQGDRAIGQLLAQLDLLMTQYDSQNGEKQT